MSGMSSPPLAKCFRRPEVHYHMSNHSMRSWAVEYLINTIGNQVQFHKLHRNTGTDLLSCLQEELVAGLDDGVVDVMTTENSACAGGSSCAMCIVHPAIDIATHTVTILAHSLYSEENLLGLSSLASRLHSMKIDILTAVLAGLLASCGKCTEVRI